MESHTVNGFFDPDPALGEIPENDRAVAAQQGTLVEIAYTAKNHMTKHAMVYLPFQYDEQAKYDVLYMMHGGGGNYHTCFESDEACFKHILDHLIQDGKLQPMIVVTPSFYLEDDRDITPEHAGGLVTHFPDELVNCLMPVVESRFATWADTVDSEGFRRSRAHRAFGGFSMGSVTTWYVFMSQLNFFGRFLPISGDCWSRGRLGGGSDPAGTAEDVVKAAQNQGAPEFFIYAATGSEDIAYPNLKPQIEAMTAHQEVFHFAASPDNGNICFSVQQGKIHCYEAVWGYLYHILPKLWPAK